MPTEKQIEAAITAYHKSHNGKMWWQSGNNFTDTVRAMLTSAELAQEAQPVPIGQHVAYFDDGQFHWMSGIRPRNCELYTSPTIPEGYQLVPIEPTSEMIGAGGLASFKSDMATGLNERKGLIASYRAMLAAAPKPGDQE